jgi:hypothetical protein
MRVSQFTGSVDATHATIGATIVWEDVDRPAVDFFVQVPTAFSDALWPDPNGFLVACILPAWQHREQRVHVEGALCPMLVDQIGAALTVLRGWYSDLGDPPRIEATRPTEARRPVQCRAASFLSCGIDSLATLRWNTLRLPAGHPLAITAAITVDYIEGHNWSAVQEGRETQKRYRAAAVVAESCGVAHLPLRTNILRLHHHGGVFAYRSHGSALSSLGHFLSRRFNHIAIASSYSADCLDPWGSHPLLDPYYSSSSLSIEHHGRHMNRFEKTRLVSDWPEGLNNLLVCTSKRASDTNCGECEKCVRTILALCALGKLESCESFPIRDVSVELLTTALGYVQFQSTAEYYRELLGPLATVRHDLATIVEQFLIKSDSSLTLPSPVAIE